MPGYIRGFVEREFADGWEFLCRVDPFTGSQGAFKYVFFGSGWASALDPVVHTPGLPDDLAPATKLTMMGRSSNALDRLSNEDLHERFRAFRERLSDRPSPRHVLLDELLEFDWERGISDENWADQAEKGPSMAPHMVLRLFDLVDADGTAYEEWDAADEDGWRGQFADHDDARRLLRGDWGRFQGRTVSLRPRSRRELVPEDWFDLLELLDGRHYGDVRFAFYWHH